MNILTRGTLVVLILALSASVAMAQSWRGMGRMAGKVTDESGKPLEGVTVKLTLPGSGGTETKSNKKGEWSIGGIARGEWQVDFDFPPYESRRIPVSIAELSRIPPVEISLKLDVNEVVRMEVVKARELMAKQDYAGARAVYEAVLAKYPTAYRLEPYIART